MHIKTVKDWIGTGNKHCGTLQGYANPQIADSMADFVYVELSKLMKKEGWTPRDIALCGVDNSSTAFAMAVIRRFQKEGERLPLFFSGRKGTNYYESEADYVTPEGDGHPKCVVFVDDDMCSGFSVSPVMALANNLTVPMFAFVIKFYMNPQDINWVTREEIEGLHNQSRFYFADTLCETIYEEHFDEEWMKTADNNKYITIGDLHEIIDNHDYY